MNWRSVWAVAAGVMVIVFVTTVVDILLHVFGVYPPMGQPMGDALSVLALSYRIVIGIGGAWLTARLAPRKPMKHALILGGVGSGLALIGLLVTWNMDLGPKWYPISLVVLGIPQCWVGGRIRELQAPQR